MEAEDRLRDMGELLKKTRKERGLSAREVAQSAHIAPAYLSMIELGNNPKTKKPSRPSPEVLSRLADILSLQPSQLYDMAGYGQSGVLIPAKSASSLPRQHKVRSPKTDWGSAPALSEQFRGRIHELEQLREWSITKRHNVVMIYGQAGIGKTSLAVKLVETIEQEFDYMMWISLRYKIHLKDVVRDFLTFVDPAGPVSLPDDEFQQIEHFLSVLEEHRCLLVLDNIESLLDDNRPGAFEEDFAGYERLIRRLGESRPIKSCLLLTSRIEPRVIANLAGKDASVLSFGLKGLAFADGQAILHDKEVRGSEEEEHQLIDLYSAVPLNLKLVAEWINDIFQGDINRFLKRVEETNEIAFGDLREVLDQPYEHLTVAERDVLIWLAILRENVTLEQLTSASILPNAQDEISARIESLLRRSLVERSASATFTLQPAIMDYVLERFVDLICECIISENYELAENYQPLESHALMHALAKDEIRVSQERLILEPIAKKLLYALGQEAVESRLRDYLGRLREARKAKSGYGAGNVLNLLVYMHCDLRGWDFSRLTIRQAYCQGVALPAVNFAGSTILESIFTETFGSILGIDFSHRDDYFAVGTADGEVRIWKSDGTPYRSFDGHANWVWAVAFSPDDTILASGSDDRTVCLWNIATGARLHELKGHENWVRTVAFHPSGTLLATGSDDATVRIWDVASGKCIKTLNKENGGHRSRIWAVAFSPDEKMLASGSTDQTVRLWDITDLEHIHCTRVIDGPGSWERVLAFSPDCKRIVTGSNDYDVQLWDIDSGKLVKALAGHTNWVWAADFSLDGTVLATGSDDQTVRLWDVETGVQLASLPGHSSRVWSVRFSRHSNRLASGSDDHTLRLWDVPHQKPDGARPIKTLHGYSDWVNAVKFSPDGKFLASSSDDHSVRLWEVVDGAKLAPHHTLWGHSSWVNALAFSHDGKYLASGSDDHTIRIWRVNPPQSYMALAGHTNWIRALAFNHDGTLLFSASDDQTVRLWKLSTGQYITLPIDHSHPGWVNSVWLNSVVFNENGSRLASGTDGHSVQLWDVHENVHPSRPSLHGHTNWIKALAFNEDSTLLATGSDDHTVRLWSIQDGICQAVLGEFGKGHSSRVWAVAFSRNGQMLASSSDDRTIILWDIADLGQKKERKLQTVRNQGGEWASTIAFSPDNTLLAGGDKEGTITIWDIYSSEVKDTATGERPYEGMLLHDVKGLTDTQKAALRTLGAQGN